MIFSRTPFRISFFGGGTDYPVWYEAHRGAVLSTTINKYCYVVVRYLPPFFDYKYRIRYTFREETQSVDEIKHPSVRACLNFLGVTEGIEMIHTSDIPARSGVGSSSSFTVGFLNSLYTLLGKNISKMQLAREAIHIEQEILKESVGSQDQMAAAFGGFNKIEFGGGGEFKLSSPIVSKERFVLLQQRFALFFTGFSRNASEVAAKQIENTPQKERELRAMLQLVDEAMAILQDKGRDLDDFGRLLNETWQLKRTLSHAISTPQIDAIYEIGKKAGALGGKLLGAGGGGFMLFYARPELQPKLKEALHDLVHVPFRFEDQGSQIIYSSVEDWHEGT